MNGIEKADSLTWDAHKLLMTPTLCAALLVRDHRHLDTAFEHEASYLFHEKVQPGFDFIHRTFECTKAGLGLRLFLVLAAVGERGLADHIDRQFDLTARAYDYFRRQRDFECPVKPESNILCFRIAGMSDEEHIRIRDRLIAGGRFYISTASFKGARYLRLVLMSPATTLDTIDRLIREVRALRDGAVENES
jgi:L-2,4-diaminobutyrate decarboxylase